MFPGRCVQRLLNVRLRSRMKMYLLRDLLVIWASSIWLPYLLVILLMLIETFLCFCRKFFVVLLMHKYICRFGYTLLVRQCYIYICSSARTCSSLISDIIISLRQCVHTCVWACADTWVCKFYMMKEIYILINSISNSDIFLHSKLFIRKLHYIKTMASY